MFSICAPHTPEGGEELEAGGEGEGGRQGKALPHRPFSLWVQFGVTPTKWVVPTSRAWELLHQGWGGAGGCRSALHRVRGTCRYPEEPLQCSPAPVQGCCCPSPLHPGLGYVGSNRGMEQALHSAWGSRPQLFRGLPARQRDVPAKLPPSPVPTVVTFWQPAEGALLQVFASQELTQSADYEARFGDAAEHLLLPVLSHRASSYPSSVGWDKKCPLYQQTGSEARWMSPGCHSWTRSPKAPHSVSTWTLLKQPQPSSSSHPPRTLSPSPFPARGPLIEDSLSCQPLVSQHACES